MKALSIIISLIFLWSTGVMAFAPGFLQVAGGGVASSCSSANDTVIDPSQETMTGGVNSANWQSRSFTLATTKTVTGVRWYCGSYSSSDIIYGEIWTDVSGSPGALVTNAAGSITNVSTTEAYNEIVFPATVSLSAGTYWIVFRGSTSVKFAKANSGIGTFKYSATSGVSWAGGAYYQDMEVLGCN
jgi:hypothetical protein